MRYYIRANGKLSSITISDALSQYLVILVGGESAEYGRGKKLAQKWINDLAEKYKVPERDVSQWVQTQIIHCIVDPVIYEQWVALKPKIAAKLKAKAERDAAFRASLGLTAEIPKSSG